MSLTGIIAKKAAVGFILFIVTVAVNFTLIHLAPGDPITYLLAGQTAEGFPRGYIEEVRAKYGLDQPIPIQFLAYTNQIFRGD
jgi:peptide/nickel transport system permease protein